MGLESYRDLRVWQLAMDIAVKCYRLTSRFPKEERYGMAGQINRSPSRIPATIAEGYGRGHRGEYLQFLRIARGSLKELETHLMLSVRVGLAPEDEVNGIISDCEDEGKMLGGLIRSLEPGQPGA